MSRTEGHKPVEGMNDERDGESATERLRRMVHEYRAAGDPFGQDNDLVQWLSWHPVKVQEAIFLILDGHYRQDHRAHLKGARTARRKKSQ